MNHLRNISDIITAKEEAQAALAKERSSHLQLKQLIRQKKALNDMLQSQRETLYLEKSNLQANKSFLGEADLLFVIVCNSPVEKNPSLTVCHNKCIIFLPLQQS